MESSAVIWEWATRNGRTTIESRDIALWARKLKRNPVHVARHLRRTGYIEPLFKGFYYVRTPEEVLLKTPLRSPVETFALAAEAKNIGPWYLGLHSALRENAMTHELRTDEAVISARMSRPGGIRIGGRRFVIHRLAPRLLDFGLIERPTYSFSDPEKTVLDMAYLDHWRRARGHPPSSEWADYLSLVDAKKVRRHLRRYPPSLRALVEEQS